jgi:hypothetical protein
MTVETLALVLLHQAIGRYTRRYHALGRIPRVWQWNISRIFSRMGKHSMGQPPPLVLLVILLQN